MSIKSKFQLLNIAAPRESNTTHPLPAAEHVSTVRSFFACCCGDEDKPRSVEDMPEYINYTKHLCDTQYHIARIFIAVNIKAADMQFGVERAPYFFSHLNIICATTFYVLLTNISTEIPFNIISDKLFQNVFKRRGINRFAYTLPKSHSHTKSLCHNFTKVFGRSLSLRHAFTYTNP